MIDRNSDVISVRRLLSLLFRNCATKDPHNLGIVPYRDAKKALTEECHGIESTLLQQLLLSFQDTQTECIFYPEMISFLSMCSVSNIIHQLQYVDNIRMKQVCFHP